MLAPTLRCLIVLLGLGAFHPLVAAETKVKEVKYPDGNIKERYSYYLDGKGLEVRDGVNEEFYPTGGKKGVRTWKAGQTEGAVIYYHPNGRKSYETNYVNGKKNGFATVWYMNGQKQWETTFKAGKTHGRWREWHLDGRKKFEATYAEGSLDGLAIWWHDSGRMWQERSYHAGVTVKGTVKEWDRAGKQVYPPPEVANTETRQDAAPLVAPPSTASKIENSR